MAASAADYRDVVQQIYIAYFGRPADPGGLAYYQDMFQRIGAPVAMKEVVQAYGVNRDLQAVIDGFGASKESQELYTGDDGAFVDAIYRNLFNRDADSGGKKYWVSLLQSKAVTRANAAIVIMLGAAADDIAIIANKTLAAVKFTAKLDADGHAKTYDGLKASEVARKMLSGVNGKTSLAEMQAGVGGAIDALSGKVAPPAIISVAAGGAYSVALRADGKLYMWGQIPLPKDGSKYYKTPTLVASVDHARSVATTTQTHFVLLADGTVRGWGVRFAGLLGADTYDYVDTPIPVPNLSNVKAIDGSFVGAQMMALKEDGTVWVWGWNQGALFGETGNVRVPQQVPGLSDVVQIAAGGEVSLALKRDGTVWVLPGGVGTRAPMVKVQQVEGIDDVVSISANWTTRYAVRRNGTVYGWGRGALPGGVEAAKPTLVAGVQNAREVHPGYLVTIVQKSDGSYVGWGDAYSGKLYFDREDMAAGKPMSLAMLSEAGSPKLGSGFGIGVNAAGRAVNWGWNAGYRLGDGTVTSRYVPAVVPIRVPQTIASISISTTGGADLQVGGKATLSASASSGLAVSFSTSTPAICSVSGDAVTGRAAGNCVVEARQAGDDAYESVAASAQLKVVGAGNNPGDTQPGDAQLQACKAAPYPGDKSDPQVYLFDYQAQFDQCLYRATGNAVFANEGDAACTTLDKLLRATSSTFRPMFCSGPRMTR